MGGGEVRLLGPEGQIWVFFLNEPSLRISIFLETTNLGSTHIKNCLNLGIAQIRGTPPPP